VIFRIFAEGLGLHTVVTFFARDKNFSPRHTLESYKPFSNVLDSFAIDFMPPERVT
jgi:hypothetical protein